MLPRAEAPVTRLPYTTADMAERLAKKKAEQDEAGDMNQNVMNLVKAFSMTQPQQKM